MAPPSPPTSNAAAVPLRIVIGRLWRRLRQLPAAAGLTPTQQAVLATIVREGPLGIAALSQREGINPTMLSRIVAKLTEGGLVSRHADPSDGRAAVVLATERGLRLQRRIRAERNDLLQLKLAGLTPELQQRLEAAMPALEALADSLLRGDY
ncbi:MAG: MarR family winged helix-turn-helix transcriptional regulator [Candidatus Dormibacteria bacterium]